MKSAVLVWLIYKTDELLGRMQTEWHHGDLDVAQRDMLGRFIGLFRRFQRFLLRELHKSK